MSKRNNKIILIHDLQSKESDVVITKHDLKMILFGLKLLDTSNFNEREIREYNLLYRHLQKLYFK